MPVAAARSLQLDLLFDSFTQNRPFAELRNSQAWRKLSRLGKTVISFNRADLHVKSKLLRLQPLALSFHETLHSTGVGIAFAPVNDRDET